MQHFTKKKPPSFIRRFSPILLLGLALCLIIVALFGDDSYRTLRQMQSDLERQHAENVKVRRYVDGVRGQLVGLRKDKRTLEKSARNELGMMHPGEVLFIFKDSETDSQ